jgi:hypothetical protein
MLPFAATPLPERAPRHAASAADVDAMLFYAGAASPVYRDSAAAMLRRHAYCRCRACR